MSITEGRAGVGPDSVCGGRRKDGKCPLFLGDLGQEEAQEEAESTGRVFIFGVGKQSGFVGLRG